MGIIEEINQLKELIIEEIKEVSLNTIFIHNRTFFNIHNLGDKKLRYKFPILTLNEKKLFIEMLLTDNEPDIQVLMELIVSTCINLVRLENKVAVVLLFEDMPHLLTQNIKNELSVYYKKGKNSFIKRLLNKSIA